MMTGGLAATIAAMLGTPQLLFLAALLAVGIWSSVKRDAAMGFTVVVLVLNCLAGWAAQVLSGSLMPLIPLIFIDTATAAVILWFARCDEQVVIGWVLTLQIGIHIGTFAAGAPPAHQQFYSNAINVIGWGQILLLTIGTHHGTRKRLRMVAALCRHFGISAAPAHARASQR